MDRDRVAPRGAPAHDVDLRTLFAVPSLDEADDMRSVVSAPTRPWPLAAPARARCRVVDGGLVREERVLDGDGAQRVVAHRERSDCGSTQVVHAPVSYAREVDGKLCARGGTQDAHRRQASVPNR